MILFIKDQIARSVIKNKFLGSQVHSKKVRNTEEMKHLEKVGDRIVVYQLDGALFFGTADGLMKEIETESSLRDVVILDFRLVKEIDLTGAQILRQVNDQLQENNKHLLLSYVTETNDFENERVSAFLTDIKILDRIGKDKLFHDTDRALEWAENYVLQKTGLLSAKGNKLTDIRKMEIFQYFDEAEIKKIAQFLSKLSYKANEVIFKEGDEGDTMYLVSRGCVSILFDIKKGKRRKRVASFGEGVFFGDMALLEEKPRSATAIAESDTDLYAFSRKDFLYLLENEPKIATKIQLGIARELSARLRSTSEELRALEMY